jgi:hypothetical protein
LPPNFAAPRRFYATTGISVSTDGVDHSEDVSVAARNALLTMIDHLTERGWTRQQGTVKLSARVTDGGRDRLQASRWSFDFKRLRGGQPPLARRSAVPAATAAEWRRLFRTARLGNGRPRYRMVPESSGHVQRT